MANQTKSEIDQAIEFHLALDKKLNNTDKSSWPEWLLEIYEKKGSEANENDK